MQSSSRAGRTGIHVVLLAVLSAAAAGCGIEKQTPPELSGPSEFGTSITLTATPDTLSRDGGSQSVITLVARDPNGAAVAGLPLTVSISPSNGGSLSAQQVVTGSSGSTTFVYTAPTIDTPVNTVFITATPVGTNFENAATRVVSISLLAPASASPTFTVTPTNPQRYQLTTLDASGTTLSGFTCGSSCTYAWTIGTEATLSGEIATHRFEQESTYVVTLAVTSPGGVTTRTQRNVTVSAAPLPTPTFTYSPTNPLPNTTVFFNASSSSAANGATIVEYTWDFGNGQSATGATPSTTYTSARSYVVRLTVRDSRGLTATTTQTVTVTTT